MQEVELIGLYVAIGISSVIQILTDPRISRRFIWKSLLALAVFALHCMIGALVLIYVIAPDVRSGFGVAGAILTWLGWLGLGGLGLVRFAPRLREPPAFIMRVGVADAVCLVMIVAGAWIVRAY